MILSFLSLNLNCDLRALANSTERLRTVQRCIRARPSRRVPTSFLCDYRVTYIIYCSLAPTSLQHRASWRAELEAAQCLLARGADINARDDVGWTPLYCAVRTKEIQAVRLLLEHGADVNARDNFGDTPSLLGSALSCPEIVELLSEYGAESVQ